MEGVPYFAIIPQVIRPWFARHFGWYVIVEGVRT
jgi:hypothetical protein